MLKQIIKNLVQKSYEKAAIKNKWSLSSIPDVLLEISKNKQYGDYSTTIAFSINKDIKKSPFEIATILISEMQRNLPKEIIKIELAQNGFINFFINKIFISPIYFLESILTYQKFQKLSYLAFFISAVFYGILMDLSWVWKLALGSLVCAVLEACCWKWFDNLFLPLCGSLAMFLIVLN